MIHRPGEDVQNVYGWVNCEFLRKCVPCTMSTLFTQYPFNSLNGWMWGLMNWVW